MKRSKKRSATAEELAQAKHALLTALLELGAASTDDAHDRFELPEGVQPKVWGSITGGLKAMGLIHRVGEVHTTRPIAHDRRIELYQISDTEAAKRELDRLSRQAANRRKRDRTLFDREGEIDETQSPSPPDAQQDDRAA